MKNISPERIDALRSRLSKPYLHAFETVINNERFRLWPGSSTKHHNWTGGLLQHTIEVAEIAVKMAEAVADVDLDVLIVSAIWHDFGKLWAYKPLNRFPDPSVMGDEHVKISALPYTTVKWVDTLLKGPVDILPDHTLNSWFMRDLRHLW